MPRRASQRISYIGQRIRARRRELGMSQLDLAGEQYTRGFISQIENGFITPSLKSLEYIAVRLGRPVAWFMEGGKPEEQESGAVTVALTQDELRRLLQTRLLSDDQLNLLERLAGEFAGATDEQLADALATLRWLKSLTPKQVRVLRGLMREFAVNHYA